MNCFIDPPSKGDKFTRLEQDITKIFQGLQLMMKKTSMISSIILLLMSLSAYSDDLSTGPWRFELKADYGTVPFIINIQKEKDSFKGILKNGKETIPLTDIEVSKEKINIPLQTYEMSLEMKLPKDGMMSGFLVRHNKNPKIKTPVIAIHGEAERFPEEKAKPKIDLTGKWAVTLLDEQDNKESGVIVFEQKENKLNGSILTPTGDYRYIEGFVSDSEFEAASFDGVYNYLLKGKVIDGKMEASILSNYKTMIEGKKDDKAKLPDAYKQTQVESGINFQFPDLKGKMVSLKDKNFMGKPVIIQFFGSWCPNCLDETKYLIPWYAKNKKRGLEIIALAFERSLSPEEAKKQLLKTQKKMNINYPLLIAGSTSEDKPQQKIPGLKNFISFPTTVFLNKKHEVVKVHAGFTGPSTGEFFERWKKEFNQTIDGLLK
jgi:thiol-disulfide isomerase/thioredoxin